MPDPRTDPYPTLRRLLLALLVVGLVGTVTELVLLGHDEDVRQWIPIVLVAVALGVITFHVAVGTAGSVQLLRLSMMLLILGGVVGVVLHFRGNLEFQVDMDPTLSAWELFKKAMRAKAPPALAPGVLVQLGLLGLIYSYRHPALGGVSLDARGIS